MTFLIFIFINSVLYFQAIILVVISPSWSTPIMVEFGTKGGPIVPPAPTTAAPSPRRYDPPAPVYEYQEDIPNPSTYKPIVPHQYRTKIYKYRPHPNLIFGTPVDKKYTLGYDKYVIYRKARKNYDLGYTGPQVFDVQEYEKENLKNRNVEISPRSYQVPQQVPQQTDYSQKTHYVPQIGVVYTSGVRYYVPQITYFPSAYDEVDNSIYDANDLKYYKQTSKSY